MDPAVGGRRLGRPERRRVAGAARGGRAAAIALASLAACAPQARSPEPPSTPGFASAPALVAALRLPGGGVRLQGSGPADATVRLLSPDGRSLGVAADAQGGWSVDLPPADAPGMWALSAEVAGRTVRAEGALAVLPPPAAAVALLARAGAPAVSPAAGGGGVRVAAVDFDGGGGLAVSGAATPGAVLKLMLDGQPAGVGRADAQGRFGLLGVGAPPRPGPHRVQVASADAVTEVAVDTAPGPGLDASPFRTARAAGGWRLDWSPPGGGVQSLFVPDAQPVGR